MNKQIETIEHQIARAILNGFFAQVLSYIKSESLIQNESVRAIYTAAFDVFENHGKVNKAVLYRSLSAEVQAYVRKVDASVFLTSEESEIPELCLILIENNIRQDLKKTLTNSLQSIENNEDVFSIMDGISSRQDQIMRRIGGLKPYDFMKNVYKQLEEIEKRVNNPEKSGLMYTGWKAFDRHSGGIEKGTLNIVAARPGMGKTALMISLIYNLSVKDKKNVMFFSLEMTESELINRLFSLHTETSGTRIKQGFNSDKEDFNSFTDRLKTFTSDSIFIKDKETNVSEIIASATEAKNNNKLDCIIIDYLQLMEGGKGENKVNQVGDLTRKLKILAKNTDVPIFLLSQLNRATETRGGSKKPQLSDLRDSGAIEQDADMVIFPYRPEYYGITENENGESTINKMLLIIAKNRSGSLSTDGIEMNCRIEFNKVWNEMGIKENTYDYLRGDSLKSSPDPSFFNDSKSNDVPF